MRGRDSVLSAQGGKRIVGGGKQRLISTQLYLFLLVAAVLLPLLRSPRLQGMLPRTLRSGRAKTALVTTRLPNVKNRVREHLLLPYLSGVIVSLLHHDGLP